MSLLSIARDAAQEIGFDLPAQIIGNNDATARQLLALANREGKMLSRRCNWAALQKEHTFSTVAGQQSYALPTDYDRMLFGSVWDRSQFRRIKGGLQPAQWQQLKSGLGNGAVAFKSFRLKPEADALAFYIDPIPQQSGQQLVFEYVSKNWCKDVSSSLTSSSWQKDTDISLLSEDLITYGLVWRFLSAKGLDFSAHFAEYEREVSQAFARDSAPQLLQAGLASNERLDANNLPEQGFGQ